MNPLHLRARSYRTFDELDLHLPQGCVAIIGPNGAGKSSIVNLVDLALFGPESRSLADQLTDDGGSDDLMIELTFEHADHTYRVRRSHNARGRGSTKLDFERLAEGEPWTDPGPDGASTGSGGISAQGANGPSPSANDWEPLTRESAAATQDAICQLIGLSRATFRASAFLAQSDGAAFTEAQPRERKRILGEVLGLDRWDTLLELVRRDRRTAEGELARIGGRLGALEDELDKRDETSRLLAETLDREIATQDQLADAERDLAQVTERYTAARETVAARDSAERLVAEVRHRVETAGHRVAEIELVVRTLPQLRVERDAAHAEALTVDELERKTEEARTALGAREQHERLHRDNDRLFEEAAELDKRAEGLRTMAAAVVENVGHVDCDRCGQTLGAQAAERAAASYMDEASALVARGAELDAQGDALVAQMDALHDALEQAPTREQFDALARALASARLAKVTFASVEGKIERASELQAEQEKLKGDIPTLQAALAEAETALAACEAVDLNALEIEGTIARSRAEQARQLLDTARADRARLEVTRDRLDAAAREAEHLQRARAELHGEVDLLAQLERAFGRDGIPSLIVENAAIPQIEVEASRILTELGTAYRVELRTERALKAGDGVRDTLDVVVVGESGERPYETFSGGERTRINLALRIALARLLAHRRGAESRLLAIDEPEFLDEAGTARLAEVLRGLGGDFDRVYLVSHVPGLRDAFDQTLEVVKVDGRSHVVGGDREAIPA